MKRNDLFCMLLCLSALPGMQAQQRVVTIQEEAFYQHQAWADAGYEQELRVQGERDEQDFWTDQRAFERRLYSEHPAAYAIYLRAKRDSYAAHQDTCGPGCHHGDFYFRQAAFYLQLGSDPEGNTWVFGPVDSGGGLVASGRDH